MFFPGRSIRSSIVEKLNIGDTSLVVPAGCFLFPEVSDFEAVTLKDAPGMKISW